MFLSETEGTGIKLSETEGTGMCFSESEGTDLKAVPVMGKFFKSMQVFCCLMLFGQIAAAEIGYIHETKEDGVYEGLIVDNAGNNVLFEGIIENDQLSGFITEVQTVVGSVTDSVDDGTGGILDSVDDGTGGIADSVDDGTGGILDSIDDGTGKLLTIQMSCGLNNNFEVSVENDNSDGVLINFELTSLYFNGAALGCSN